MKEVCCVATNKTFYHRSQIENSAEDRQLNMVQLNESIHLGILNIINRTSMTFQACYRKRKVSNTKHVGSRTNSTQVPGSRHYKQPSSKQKTNQLKDDAIIPKPQVCHSM